GVDIKVDKIKYRTLPAKCEKLIVSMDIPNRNPPIRHRVSILTSWIQLRVNEGKNRQIRKMCASVGFPVLRLIRIAIGKYKLGPLNIGEVKEIHKSQII
ncbi:MAG: pseudouridine synthase, partial [Saprospiraceae bacterium]